MEETISNKPQIPAPQVSATEVYVPVLTSQISASQSRDSQVYATQSIDSQVSAAPSWQWNNRYQQYNNQQNQQYNNQPNQQYYNQHNQQHNLKFQLQSNCPAQSNNYQQTLTTPLPVREETSLLTHPFTYMDQPQLQISQQLLVSPEDSEKALPVPPAEMVEEFRSLIQPIVQKYMKEVCNYHDSKNKTFHELQKIPSSNSDFEE